MVVVRADGYGSITGSYLPIRCPEVHDDSRDGHFPLQRRHLRAWVDGQRMARLCWVM